MWHASFDFNFDIGICQAASGAAWSTRQSRHLDCCAGMLDHIRVEAYGEKMPLHTLATVLARDAQLLVASVYDPSVSICCRIRPGAPAAGYRSRAAAASACAPSSV